ncbi:MAG: hypothetical protein CFE23_04230 [Flavobacterium sp. BFFFF1]|uniref:hypothetical protein n=1 Tax=Flavobacterium sp. BFFFF1 TaxID=2015557 RepID=UPI000BD3B48A|nr:hypothetical protein [Flavobacterium sp. BFFFF1]OYU81684.1 MAG: hypothetical protein CFE23_04230 [Flavobacterium sp. BFFFF1]
METNNKNPNDSQNPSKNGPAKKTQKDDTNEGGDSKYTSPDKYLALEQPGVVYTQEQPHTSNSDYLEYDNDEQRSDKFRSHHQNSRNAEAFSQDDYILRDNLDLDEDQPNSISSDDAPDRNTTDETA